eukprot:6560666-Alexandrium_andersonii.AAC.1
MALPAATATRASMGLITRRVLREQLGIGLRARLGGRPEPGLLGVAIGYSSSHPLAGSSATTIKSE